MSAFVMAVPDEGALTFLVLGECECGWWCACHEGAHWPKCPVCGEQVLPPSASQPNERQAFEAELGLEREVVERVRVATA